MFLVKHQHTTTILYRYLLHSLYIHEKLTHLEHKHIHMSVLNLFHLKVVRCSHFRLFMTKYNAFSVTIYGVQNVVRCSYTVLLYIIALWARRLFGMQSYIQSYIVLPEPTWNCMRSYVCVYRVAELISDPHACIEVTKRAHSCSWNIYHSLVGGGSGCGVPNIQGTCIVVLQHLR